MVFCSEETDTKRLIFSTKIVVGGELMLKIDGQLFD